MQAKNTFAIATHNLYRAIKFTALLIILVQFYLVMRLDVLPFIRQSDTQNTIMAATIAVKENFLWFLPWLIMMMAGSLLEKRARKSAFFKDGHQSNKRQQFGSATFANQTDLKRLNAYDPNNGIFVGADDRGKPLFLPLTNKLTLSPPGGGKTTSSSIPALLSHDGPVLALDIKGELWAVTARYRHEVLKRNVITIDPFGVTSQPGFSAGKNDALLQRTTINPFDFLPAERSARDRILNAFASALVQHEHNIPNHFDDNAKILIRGFIDYLMQTEDFTRNLTTLYAHITQNSETAQQTFERMSQLEGRAQAAANQILRVGSDERGSILSTTYRQIDWLGDSNMARLLSVSNVDLRDFLNGNMDIFVILPEDQVKEHGRLMRLLLVLIMGLLVQANPQELPRQKMLFLLDEVAQLGASPDVEQCIEILRARGVVVWAVFQSLRQIKMFKKPDLFTGIALKQIFTTDDLETMQWIQGLAGKKTILTETKSINHGVSQQKTQFFGGSTSSGDGQSVQETGVDLIPLNEIRELPYNQQLIFLQGEKPIRCQKVRYFEHPLFKGRFDQNPLETKW